MRTAMEEVCGKIPIGMCFSVIHHSFRCRMDELLREYELTGPQLGLLGQLHHLEKLGGEVNQRDVENAVHLSHTTVTEMLKRLEGKGFIVSSPSETDRRSKCLHTTDKEKALNESIHRLDEQVFDRLCRDMTETQRTETETIMRVMFKNALAMKGSMEEQ